MAILTPADFRPDTTHEACVQRTLTAQEAESSDLTLTIARMTQRVYDLTHDEFESSSQTFELSPSGGSNKLDLPKRTTALTTVKTRYYDGTLTTQTASTYRLVSSLDSTGSKRVGNRDYIWIIPDAGGFSNVLDWPYEWPAGQLTVQVTATVGWTVTPTDIKRAVATLVWDHYKEQRGDLGRAKSINAGGTQVLFVPDEPTTTGIPEVDEIIRDYTYQGGSTPTVLIA